MATETTTYDASPMRGELQREVFGVHSTLDTAPRIVGGWNGDNSLSYNTTFEMMVMVTLLLYILWFKGDMHRRSYDREREVSLSSRLFSWVMALSICIVATTKFMDIAANYNRSNPLIDFDPVAAINHIGFGLWSGAIASSFVTWLIWSGVGIWLIDRVSQSNWVWSSLMKLRETTMRIGIMVGIPLVLLSALERSGYIMFGLMITLVAIVVISYLIRSFLLFRSKKISILNWILYLCTIEILPFTLMWAIFTRSVT